ncbi:MAG: hypothetical protein GTO45_04750 [Candidatus Aminicenantes bacterium]|nr:hypothetical protein [Candidatus Aminicenantes bacterium]NIM78062.1 hypothetical protein [Candidatus Aminicenantes bacterium]NIN17379.1 hypothetical protein [Candidatus Aminicenantes bacterium]NIN41272.1 hypothetical protein [Candidatus Aminicenantes bacterium]NIN84045.1 hypothetical protein [Candidatus Aminicenantes bacterium]
MKKIIFVLILLLLVFSMAIHGEKAAVLTEIMKPVTLSVDDTQFYVTEGASIYIYSLKEFKMLKKFGREGQGPQEFQILPYLPLAIDASTDKLIAISFGKISYFTKKGEFIKEVRSSGLVFYPQPFGDQFLGMSVTAQDGVRYRTVNIYDSKLTKLKEIYREKDVFQAPGRGTKAINKAFIFQGHDNKILLPGKDDATIDVFDRDMKKLFSIHLDQKKIKIDQKFKDQVIHHAKTSPETKDLYPVLKPLIFPDYFPVIAAFFADADMIYVMTYKKENSSNEFFTYDMTGKFKKHLMVPIQYETPVKPYPITIHKGKLYQIVENEEEEEWEFHMSEIK